MKINKKLKGEFILEMVILIVGLAEISFLYRRKILLLSLIAAGLIILAKFWYKKGDINYFLVGAILGPLGEMVCIHFGAWYYTDPSFLGIPIWQPLAWGAAAVMIRRIADTMSKIEKETLKKKV